ncbi:ferredoxin [Ideonella sp. B7]|uniref:ferredoxin n=1 Tax=Ideonella benzenivorans TaxID=2831643 RepID=UPI001CECABEC|nr:ferredoxin [Ideonella benzenivorans]MCA6217136.1 ferredoxin [Ideonella benzenivorans]
MYVILTSKAGQFRTESGPGLTPIEAYDYLLCGHPRARFVIAEIEGDPRVRVVDTAGRETVNLVPSKFLARYASLDQARGELTDLCHFGQMELALRPVPLQAITPGATA